MNLQMSMATPNAASLFSEAVDAVLGYAKGESRDVVEKAFEDLGVESIRDFSSMDPVVDLKFMKPIQARKLKGFIDENLVEKRRKSLAPSSPSSPCSSRSSCFARPGTPSSPAEAFQVPYHKLSIEVMQKLEKGKVLLRTDRLELKDVILRDLLALTRNPGKALLTRVAKSVCIEKYPQSMRDKIGAGHESFLPQLIWAAENKNCKRRALALLHTPGVDEGLSSPKRMKPKDRYGCVEEQYLPLSLLQGHTVEMQEAKRLWLKEQSSLVPADRDLRRIAQNMSDTYASQRFPIAGARPKVEDVVRSWPFMAEATYLRSHFERLTAVSFKDAHSVTMGHLPKLLKYIRSETEGKNRGKVSTAKKESYNLPLSIQTKYEQSKKMFDDDFICASLCLMHMMSQEDSILLQLFPEHTSVDEILAATKTSTPHVAVLGDDLQSAKKCIVIVEGCALEEITTLCDAIFLAFASYFIYGIAYPKAIASYLQFIEKVLIKIECYGSKVQRKNSAVAHIESRLKSEMLRYDTYCATWGILEDQSVDLIDGNDNGQTSE